MGKNVSAKKNDWRKEKGLCSLFEEMLMWTSYRYAIGRKSYVSCLAYEIPQAYYSKLTDDRKQFTSEDLRREIADRLRFMPFDLDIHRMYGEDEFNAVKAVLEFIRQQNITNLDEFVKISKIRYDSHTGEYEFETRRDVTINTYFSVSDIDDLIPWETFASCFDLKNYVTVGGYEYFRTWQRCVVPVDGKENVYRCADFGWEPVWLRVEDFLKSQYCPYTREEDFMKLRDTEENKTKETR